MKCPFVHTCQHPRNNKNSTLGYKASGQGWLSISSSRTSHMYMHATCTYNMYACIASLSSHKRKLRRWKSGVECSVTWNSKLLHPKVKWWLPLGLGGPTVCNCSADIFALKESKTWKTDPIGGEERMKKICTIITPHYVKFIAFILRRVSLKLEKRRKINQSFYRKHFKSFGILNIPISNAL